MIIAALASAPGKAGISVIRLSGKGSCGILKEFLTSARIRNNFEYNRLYFTKFVNEGELIDEVTVVFFKEDHSYTGEESAEIFCHGSPLIVKKILEALYESKKVRKAQPGEFTQRRFMNGKTDLVQAEAVIDLINSESDAAYTASKEQLEGGLSIELKKINQMLIDLISLLEIELDFSEEELEFTPAGEICDKIGDAIEVINKFIQGYKKGRIYKDGIKVVLAGEVNVGKSSLMNRLLQSDRVIVTDIAGTTRDTIEEKIEVHGYLLRLFDTAGLRETDDIIESEGITRSKKLLKEADIVLQIIDSANEASVTEIEAENVIRVYNKCDLKDIPVHSGSVKISCKTGQGIEELKDLMVKTVIEENMSYQPYYISNLRHLNVLKETAEKLQQAKITVSSSDTNEVIILDLRQALDTLGELTGETTSLDIINNIFSKFCIGK
ncbi:MAG TPA: tRNA uridine-5-carboxymethylaminomethyl(34) synthesis GTPase MnmE [Clostridiales bacterium]|jgi:tRNA modification GTPase|nr:tRNA uridine-5-carboxymethylaminomethyl(34) synthesis GTPase MnmE [Clostridiales bacterium]HQP70431.1 tRNA uridine-5-carboxymethylaminomethyl(34) synthesis GTPase MnmE [Clostridiales bacterium]